MFIVGVLQSKHFLHFSSESSNICSIYISRETQEARAASESKYNTVQDTVVVALHNDKQQLSDQLHKSSALDENNQLKASGSGQLTSRSVSQ